MDERDRIESHDSEQVGDLINRGVESLALLVELISALKEKGILSEEEIGEMGKRAERLRVQIIEGNVPS
jgi:hypothetical protein